MFAQDAYVDCRSNNKILSCNKIVAVCTLLERGIIGMFGPSSTYTSNYIQSICDNKEIPQIETHFDPKIERNRCVVNLHPHASEIAQFFVHLVSNIDYIIV